jgi:hypothetical protein
MSVPNDRHHSDICAQLHLEARELRGAKRTAGLAVLAEALIAWSIEAEAAGFVFVARLRRAQAQKAKLGRL